MTGRLSLAGGAPVRSKPYPAWPVAPASAEDDLLAVLHSGHWWQSGGGAAERLEHALADWFGVQRVIGVANGTVAIELALRALGVGHGDEVLTPASTFVSTATAVATVGAQPVPVDIDPATINIDINAAGDRLTARTKAMIVVHLAGQPADLVAARDFCDRHGLALIEDSAQAVTSAWAGSRVGTVGDLATLSFQAAKLLPGGDGGAVLVPRDNELARRVELLANCGRPRGGSTYDHEVIGTNGRISEFNAALTHAHLAGFEALAATREATARAALRALPPGTAVDVHPQVSRHDRYMLLLRVPGALTEQGIGNRAVVAALVAEGIPAQVLYPTWSRLPAFATTPVARQECPHSFAASREVIWLHHRLLLDADLPNDLAAAWDLILASPDVLRAVKP